MLYTNIDTHLLLWTHPYFMRWITFFFLYFHAQVPDLSSRSPFQLALCPSDTAPSILAQPSGTWCSWLALYLICPSPGISYFSKEPYFLLVEIVSK